MNRKEILKEAQKLISGRRAKDYGDAYENHERIAKMWSVLLDTAVKLSRLIVTPEHEDSWVDICGYGALGGEGNGLTDGDVRPKK